ncbi:MAG: hypothetical protein FWG97_00285 [Deltaproteobacteria bacterium]|nr:hypothetical protein [Deltaproteobacteria bacterium]
MRSFNVAAGEGAHRVEVLFTLIGADACLCIAGGRTPHIGAAALAIPRESLRSDGELSASASVLCVTGHKEDELAREAALRFAARLGGRVLVSAGLHIDQAGARDIRLLLENCRAALDLAMEKLEPLKSGSSG